MQKAWALSHSLGNARGAAAKSLRGHVICEYDWARAPQGAHMPVILMQAN